MSEETEIAVLLSLPWGRQENPRAFVRDFAVDWSGNRRFQLLVDRIPAVEIDYSARHEPRMRVIHRDEGLAMRAEYRDICRARQAAYDRERGRLLAAIERGSSVIWTEGQNGGTFRRAATTRDIRARGVCRKLALSEPESEDWTVLDVVEDRPGYPRTLQLQRAR